MRRKLAGLVVNARPCSSSQTSRSSGIGARGWRRPRLLRGSAQPSKVSWPVYVEQQLTPVAVLGWQRNAVA